MGMDESLFARLDSENNTVTLKLQYRMNRRIMAIANVLTYDDCMKAANNQIADATLKVKDSMVRFRLFLPFFLRKKNQI